MYFWEIIICCGDETSRHYVFAPNVREALELVFKPDEYIADEVVIEKLCHISEVSGYN